MCDKISHNHCGLAYELHGEGTPVLFIQGVGVPGGGWRPQVEALPSHFACLSFDNRGLGASAPPDGRVTVESMADDALAVMDAVNWESAHLVGHSLGGLVSLQLALTARRRVRSLSLLCTFPSGKAAAPLTPRMAWLGMRSRVGTRRMRRSGFLRLITPPGTPHSRETIDQMTSLFGRDLADQPPIIGGQLRALRAADLSDRLSSLSDLPALVVSATHDPIAPPTAGQSLATALASARYVEIQKASHALPITHAEIVNRLLKEHIQAIEIASVRQSRGE